MTIAGDSGSFETPGAVAQGNAAPPGVGPGLEALGDAAKVATSLAVKLRTTLSALADNVKSGKVSSAPSLLQRASEYADELTFSVSALTAEFELLGTNGTRVEPAAYVDELNSALARRGLEVKQGPEPYWLVYPAWFQVRRNDKDVLEVIVNGSKLDTVHPEHVADQIQACVADKFDAKKFADGLHQTRILLRRMGAVASSMALDDLYEVYQGRRNGTSKEFAKSDFYYAVHRLAEALEQTPGASLSFPLSSRSEILFFTRHGEGRKYLMADFSGGSDR